MKKYFRPIFYGIVIIIFLLAIFVKRSQIIAAQKSVVVSQIAEVQKNGKPVEIEKIILGPYSRIVKLSATIISKNELEAFVSNNIWEHLDVNQKFISSEETGAISGAIKAVSSNIDFATGLYRVLLSASKQMSYNDGVIPVYITVKAENKVISIPKSSVMNENNQYFVWVVNGKHSFKRAIKVLDDNAERVLVASGLSPNEQVVFQGTSILENEDLVNVVKCIGCK